MELNKDNKTSKYLIDRIWFMNEHGDSQIEAPYYKDDNKKKLYYLTEYYGDHSENWVIEENEGKEVARHNTKFIATIEWSEKLNF